MKDLPSDRKVLVKAIRKKVSSALLCEINRALSLLVRFFLRPYVVEM